MRSPAASTSASRCRGSVTSPARAKTPGTCAHAASRASGPRASTTSRQPRSASAYASARPRPREAPVTIPTGTESPYERPGPERQRQLVLGLPAEPGRIQRGLRPVGAAELGEHVAHVRLDRLLGDTQLEPDA